MKNGFRDFLSFSPGSQYTYPLRGDGRQARQQQKSTEIDNAGPGKSQTDLKQFMKNGRLGANQSSRAIFLELTGSSTGWRGIPPHLSSHMAKVSMVLVGVQATLHIPWGNDSNKLNRDKMMAADNLSHPWQPRELMTMPGFCFVFPIFSCYEGTVGRRRHMTGMVISIG